MDPDEEPAAGERGVPDAAARAGIDPPIDLTERRAAAHAAMIEAYEERLAEQRASSIEAGRRKGGAAGAAMAGAMLAVAEIYEGPPKDDAPVTVEASSDPHDVDRDGIDMTVEGTDVESPPLDRVDPIRPGKRRR